MLTRLQVDGFKNLLDVDVRFGPFTCIAGANGVGKSNLFDAIRFLSALAEKPLIEAALSVRGEGGQGGDIANLFQRAGEHIDQEMSFAAEMLIPPEGIDDLGQETQATMTFLRYELEFERREHKLQIRHESLQHINKGDAYSRLAFPHRKTWRESVVTGRRTSPFISTVREDERILIKLHNDGAKDYLGGGRPRPHAAERLPRTVLSSATNAAESPTAVLARREMQSWRLLQLEPSALRAPDPYNAPSSMQSNGAHLPATLARLAHWNRANYQSDRESPDATEQVDSEAVYANVANRLSELIDDVHSIRIDADDTRELLKLMLRDREGTEHEAKALSDGTLRFLALAILESDPVASGVLCLEEPENGIHPERIPAMLRLLQDLATDPEQAVDRDNPLRQVIVNTHSPAVVSQIEDDDLLVVVPEKAMRAGHLCTRPAFRWLKETWRAESQPDIRPVPSGRIKRYLNPYEPAPPSRKGSKKQRRRVMDRREFQESLPFAPSAASA